MVKRLNIILIDFRGTKQMKKVIYNIGEKDYFLEPIETMSTIGRNENPSFAVTVNPDSGRMGDCYFKYFNSADYRTADKLARISFTEPKKVIHKNTDGKQEWELNVKDKKILCKFLSSKSRKYKSLNITNWQSALYHWNYEYGFFTYDYPDDYGLEIEAYLDGFYDNIEHPSYLKSTLRMPDYTLIP